MGTAKAQISLCLRAGWSGTLLSAYSIIVHIAHVNAGLGRYTFSHDAAHIDGTLFLGMVYFYLQKIGVFVWKHWRDF